MEAGFMTRSMGKSSEWDPTSSIIAGLAFGGRWKFHITWRLFPGRNRNLSFLGIGAGYTW